MSYTVNERVTGRKARHTLADGHESTREFVVTSSDRDGGPEGALSAAGVPRVGESLVGRDGFTDPTRKLQSKEARLEGDSGDVWIVTCTYRTLEGQQGGPGIGDEPPEIDPKSLPPEIEKTYEVTSVPAYQDQDGNAIDNSAGEVFDPPLEQDLYDLVVRITRNERPIRLSKLRSFQGTINKERFWGDDEHTWRVRISATGHEQGRFRYDRVVYELTHRADGWPRVLLDQGYLRLDPGDLSKQLQIVDNEGLPVSAPVRLDGSGAPLALASAPVFLPSFRLEAEADFALLNLPTVS